MTPEIEEANKLIIQSTRSSLEARIEAIEQMWKEKIKGMMFENIASYIETFPPQEQLEVKEEKCHLYFDGAMSSTFGFKDYEAVNEIVAKQYDSNLFGGFE